MDNIRFGTNLDTGEAIEWKRDEIAGKMVSVRGGTGSGKSLALGLVTSQLIRPYAPEDYDSVIVINFSEDLFFINRITELMMACGREEYFKWLSLAPHDDSFHFDPLQALSALQGNLTRQANFITAANSLAYGFGFPTGFYGRQNASVIREALERHYSETDTLPSIADMAISLTAVGKSKQARKDPSEALYAFDALRDYECLIESADSSKNIDIEKVIANSEVLYCHLPTLAEGLSSQAVGLFVFWSVIHIAANRRSRGLPPKRVWIVVEEGAQIVHSKSYGDAITLARKLGITLIFSYQSEAQLRGTSKTTDMSNVVRDNSNIRIFMTTATDRNSSELQELLGYSDDETKKRMGRSGNGLDISFNEHEYEEPRLTVNQVIRTNRIFGAGYIVKDYGEPIAFQTSFPVSKAEHALLDSKSLPKKPTNKTDEGRELERRAGSNQPHGIANDHDANRRAMMLRDLDAKLREEGTI